MRNPTPSLVSRLVARTALRRCLVLLGLLIMAHAASLGSGGAAAAGRSSTGPAAANAAVPVRLRIPAIKLNERLVSVGLDKQRRPIVPMHNLGWYLHSARPGQGNNVVIWGHVLRFKATPKIPAPFERVAELKIGTQITVETSNGRAHRYVVTRQVWAKPSEVKYILPTGKEQLTLVSCIGKNVIVRGSLTKEYRLINIATPAR